MDEPPGEAARERHRLVPDRRAGKLFRETLKHLRATAPDREDMVHFLAFAAARAGEAQGQMFQDLWALWEAGDRDGGYFVEFGGGDGVHLSNTWYLEKKRGWRGVVAEPNPDFAEALAANRSCHVSGKAVFSEAGTRVAFRAARRGEMSRLEAIAPEDRHEREGVRQAHRMIEVETITLMGLLEEAAAPFDIDYMSIDTEGSEFAILDAFDFSSRNIRCISVEHNFTPNRDLIHDLLVKHGYRRKWDVLSMVDDWYVRD